MTEDGNVWPTQAEALRHHSLRGRTMIRTIRNIMHHDGLVIGSCIGLLLWIAILAILHFTL